MRFRGEAEGYRGKGEEEKARGSGLTVQDKEQRGKMRVWVKGEGYRVKGDGFRRCYGGGSGGGGARGRTA